MSNGDFILLGIVNAYFALSNKNKYLKILFIITALSCFLTVLLK